MSSVLFLYPLDSHFSTESPLISQPEAVEAMASAFRPFIQYIQYLAEGKLDGYFNSTQQAEALVTDFKVKLPDWPMLLLHNLGNHPNDVRLTRVFESNT